MLMMLLMFVTFMSMTNIILHRMKLMSGRKVRRRKSKRPVNKVAQDQAGNALIVPQEEIPEPHVLKSFNVSAGDSGQGEKLPQTGSIYKLIIKVDTSGASFTGGTSPAFVSRAADLVLKSFTLKINDPWFGARDVISGTYALLSYRQVRRTLKTSSDVAGEFVVEFPNQPGFNSMLPAGATSAGEFTFSYQVGSISELESTGTAVTAIDGISIEISCWRYQKVYAPNAAITIINKVVTVSATGDLEVSFNNGHFFKRLSFVSYNTSDALADIVNDIELKNTLRLIAKWKPDGFRAYINDEYGATPDNGIIIFEFATPHVTNESKATLDISNSTDVELYALQEEVEMLVA